LDLIKGREGTNKSSPLPKSFYPTGKGILLLYLKGALETRRFFPEANQAARVLGTTYSVLKVFKEKLNFFLIFFTLN
jgi:hypothetical protein